jgi:hypothetical protein
MVNLFRPSKRREIVIPAIRAAPARFEYFLNGENKMFDQIDKGLALVEDKLNKTADGIKRWWKTKTGVLQSGSKCKRCEGIIVEPLYGILKEGERSLPKYNYSKHEDKDDCYIHMFKQLSDRVSSVERAINFGNVGRYYPPPPIPSPPREKETDTSILPVSPKLEE